MCALNILTANSKPAFLAGFLLAENNRGDMGSYNPGRVLFVKLECLENIAFAELMIATRDVLACLRKYSANQLRVPAGNPDGGQWTATGSNSGVHSSSGNVHARVTVHSNMKVTIHHPNGMDETRSGGSRAWRNNNPGNIRAGNFAVRQGAIGENNGFAVFPDRQAGAAASAALLKTPFYRDLSVDEAIAKRSPPNENNTGRTQQLIRDFSGLSGKEKINSLSESQLYDLANAIAKAEGEIPGKVVKNKK